MWDRPRRDSRHGDTSDSRDWRRGRSGIRAIRRKGFDTAAVEHLRHLQRAARHLTNNASDAEDLTQDTYVRALRASQQFRWGTNFRAWLLAILRNTDRNRRRGAARSIVEVDSEKVDRLAGACGHTDTPERRLLDKTLDEDVKAAVQSLPAVLRDALWLRDAGELSYEEIAHRLGIPVGTVMSRLARARRLLYARMTQARR